MNLIDEKYRTLKATNKKISALVSYREVVEILKAGGFEQMSPGFVMKNVSISRIDEVLEVIEKYKVKEEPFNPYASHVVSRGATTVSSYEGGQDSSMMWKEKLDEL